MKNFSLPSASKFNLSERTSINLPPDMKEMLDEEALANGRSLSAEIMIRLRKSLGMPPLSKRPAVTRNRKSR